MEFSLKKPKRQKTPYFNWFFLWKFDICTKKLVNASQYHTFINFFTWYVKHKKAISGLFQMVRITYSSRWYFYQKPFCHCNMEIWYPRCNLGWNSFSKLNILFLILNEVWIKILVIFFEQFLVNFSNFCPISFRFFSVFGKPKRQANPKKPEKISAENSTMNGWHRKMAIHTDVIIVNDEVEVTFTTANMSLKDSVCWNSPLHQIQTFLR